MAFFDHYRLSYAKWSGNPRYNITLLVQKKTGNGNPGNIGFEFSHRIKVTELDDNGNEIKTITKSGSTNYFTGLSLNRHKVEVIYSKLVYRPPQNTSYETAFSSNITTRTQTLTEWVSRDWIRGAARSVSSGRLDISSLEKRDLYQASGNTGEIIINFRKSGRSFSFSEYKILLVNDGDTRRIDVNSRDRQIITGLAPGTYQVYLEESYAFNNRYPVITPLRQMVLARLYVPIRASISTSRPSAYGASDGQAIINIQSGHTPLSYRWSDRSSRKDRHDLAVGDYSVTISDPYGNSQAYSVTITIPVVTLHLRVSTTDVSHYGGSDGSAIILVENGAPPYRYHWSDGSAQGDRSDLQAQVYSVRVTDRYNNSGNREIQIFQPEDIRIDVVIDTNNVRIDVEGGRQPYTYRWSDGSTTKNRQNLAGGTYVLTVIDSVGYSKTRQVRIEDFDFVFTENPVYLDLKAEDLINKSNFSFKCEVLVEEEYLSNNFIRVITAEQPAKADGTASFDVQDFLAAYVESDFPDPGTRQITRSNAFRRYRLRHNEKYGVIPTDRPVQQVNIRYVAKGGLNTREFAKDVFFSRYVPNQKPFLTWLPNTEVKDVFPGQLEFLYFPVMSLIVRSIALKVNTTALTGETWELDRLDAVRDVRRNEIYRIPVSREALGIGDDVYEYQVWLVNQTGERVSEKRTYRVREERKYFRQFLFENSLGAFETLPTIGEAKGKMRVRSQTLVKQLPKGYLPTDAKEETLSKVGVESKKLGFYSTNESIHPLKDFALSRKVYEYANGFLTPVQIDCQPNILDEEDNAIDFEFWVKEEPFRLYTPLL